MGIGKRIYSTFRSEKNTGATTGMISIIFIDLVEIWLLYTILFLCSKFCENIARKY